MENVRVLPNTIDAELIPESGPAERQAPPPVRILYLSNFIVEKGYFTLLEAGELLADQGLADRFILTFHGKWLSEADRMVFEARAATLTERGLKVFVGESVTDRNMVRELYSSHHVFCLPSDYAAEAQPRSIIEAMANGCAVVATRYRSIPDLVVPGETGLLIDERSPVQLADALSNIVKSDLRRMGAAGAARFGAQFSSSLIQQQLFEALGLGALEEGVTS